MTTQDLYKQILNDLFYYRWISMLNVESPPQKILKKNHLLSLVAINICVNFNLTVFETAMLNCQCEKAELRERERETETETERDREGLFYFFLKKKTA